MIHSIVLETTTTLLENQERISSLVEAAPARSLVGTNDAWYGNDKNDVILDGRGAASREEETRTIQSLVLETILSFIGSTRFFAGDRNDAFYGNDLGDRSGTEMTLPS